MHRAPARRLLLFTLALLAALAALPLVKPLRIPAATASACCEPPGLQSQPIHKLEERDLGTARDYRVRNLVDGPIEVRCLLSGARNVRSVQPLPARLVLAAGESRHVTELRMVDARRPAQAEVVCEAIVGDPRAQPATSRAYGFPLLRGTRFTLDQGFGGRFSHRHKEAWHALDFGVPEGTPVVAARGGVVMQAEGDFRANGTDAARYGDRANYVRILHEDGSMAVYAHLAPDSLVHQPGDRVVAGQLIARSGNTGFSTGPHLHFSVQRNAGMALESVPFSVIGVDARGPRGARRLAAGTDRAGPARRSD